MIRFTEQIAPFCFTPSCGLHFIIGPPSPTRPQTVDVIQAFRQRLNFGQRTPAGRCRRPRVSRYLRELRRVRNSLPHRGNTRTRVLFPLAWEKI